MLLLALSLFARSRPSHHSVQDVAPHNRAVRFAGRPPPASAPSAGGADAFVPAGGHPSAGGPSWFGYGIARMPPLLDTPTSKTACRRARARCLITASKCPP